MILASNILLFKIVNYMIKMKIYVNFVNKTIIYKKINYHV